MGIHKLSLNFITLVKLHLRGQAHKHNKENEILPFLTIGSYDLVIRNVIDISQPQKQKVISKKKFSMFNLRKVKM